MISKDETKTWPYSLGIGCGLSMFEQQVLTCCVSKGKAFQSLMLHLLLFENFRSNVLGKKSEAKPSHDHSFNHAKSLTVGTSREGLVTTLVTSEMLYTLGFPADSNTPNNDLHDS